MWCWENRFNYFHIMERVHIFVLLFFKTSKYYLYWLYIYIFSYRLHFSGAKKQLSDIKSWTISLYNWKLFMKCGDVWFTRVCFVRYRLSPWDCTLWPISMLLEYEFYGQRSSVALFNTVIRVTHKISCIPLLFGTLI